MTERPIYASVIKRNQSKVVPVALSSRATTTPEQPQKYMIIANAIFYNGIEPDKVYLGENLVWEKSATPPTPTYGSKTFAGKFTDTSTSSYWQWWPNGQAGSVGTSIAKYVDPETKEFNFEYNGTLTSCEYLCNGNGSYGRFERIDHIPDTSGVKNFSFMFSNNTNTLKTINVSDLNTSSATDMSRMFYNCYVLTSLDVSNFDTSKVTNMDRMFYSCSVLPSLDVSNFDTSKVTNMNRMFYHCDKLPSLDVSNFDTSKVTNMDSMFYWCIGLATLNLSGWNVSSVVNMDYMFSGCYNLTTALGPITGIAVNIDLYHSPLTAASAMVFINGLAEVETAKTITFKATTYDQLTPEQIAVATNKGWNIVRS